MSWDVLHIILLFCVFSALRHWFPGRKRPWWVWSQYQARSTWFQEPQTWLLIGCNRLNSWILILIFWYTYDICIYNTYGILWHCVSVVPMSAETKLQQWAIAKQQFCWTFVQLKQTTFDPPLVTPVSAYRHLIIITNHHQPLSTILISNQCHPYQPSSTIIHRVFVDCPLWVPPPWVLPRIRWWHPGGLVRAGPSSGRHLPVGVRRGGDMAQLESARFSFNGW